MAEEKFLRLNVAFVIPEEIASVAMNMSREIAEEEDAFFVLDGVEYFPHSTIYPGDFPEKNLEKIKDKLKITAKKLSPVEMVFEYSKAENGWIGFHFKYSQEIKKIHTNIMSAIDPLREGRVREKHRSTEYLAGISEEQRKNVEKYGYPNLMELYEPHLTLTKLKSNQISRRFKVSDLNRNGSDNSRKMRFKSETLNRLPKLK